MRRLLLRAAAVALLPTLTAGKSPRPALYGAGGAAVAAFAIGASLEEVAGFAVAGAVAGHLAGRAWPISPLWIGAGALVGAAILPSR